MAYHFPRTAFLFIASLFLFTIPRGTGVVVVTVTTESELKAAAATGSGIKFGANIAINSQIELKAETGATIDGNGFTLDGQSKTRCLWIEVRTYIKDLDITNCRTGGADSGANGNWGGAMMVYGPVQVYLSGGMIASNGASLGGGIFLMNGASVAATNTEFSANSASGGGAIYIMGATMVCSGCNFFSNSGDYGKDACLSSCSLKGAFEMDCSSPSSYNNLIVIRGCGAGSYGTQGGALHVEDSENVLSGDPVFSYSCTYCPAGTRSASEVIAGSDVSSCTSCELPLYSDGEPLLVAGVYQGHTSCDDCPVGFILDTTTGATSCTACAAGRFAGTQGLLSCDECNTGEYSFAAAETCYSECPEGSYQGSGQACIPCGEGHFQDRAGQSSCKPCELGSFQDYLANANLDKPGMTDCILCSNGYYTSSPAQTSCASCAEGSFVDAIIGAKNCTSCGVGSYQTETGQLSCESCPSGSVLNAPTGATSCTSCEPGRVQVNVGLTSCEPCAAGRAQPLAGQTSCVACEPGKAQAEEGKASCSGCEAGRWEAATNQTECSGACAAGTSTNGNTGSTSVDDCKDCGASTIAKQPGSPICTQCASADFCPNGLDCRDGHNGPTCGLCDAGWFWFDGLCQRCPASASALLPVALSFAFLVCAAVFYATGIQNLDITNKLKIAFNHCQISAICFSFHLSFPRVFFVAAEYLFGILSFNFIDLASPECSLGSLSYVERWTMAAVSPLVLMVPFLVLAVAAKCIGGDSIRSRSLSTVSVIASATFVWGVKSCMEAWACDLDDGGTTILIVAPEVPCTTGDSRYGVILALSIILFFVYVFFVQVCIACALADPLVKKTVCGGLKDDLSWWYKIQIAFKLLTVICALYVASPIGQVMMMAALIFALAVSTAYMQPYVNAKDTSLEVKLYCVEIAQLAVSYLAHIGILGQLVGSAVLFLLVAYSAVTTALSFKGLTKGMHSLWTNKSNNEAGEGDGVAEKGTEAPKEGAASGIHV